MPKATPLPCKIPIRLPDKNPFTLSPFFSPDPGVTVKKLLNEIVALAF